MFHSFDTRLVPESTENGHAAVLRPNSANLGSTNYFTARKCVIKGEADRHFCQPFSFKIINPLNVMRPALQIRSLNRKWRGLTCSPPRSPLRLLTKPISDCPDLVVRRIRRAELPFRVHPRKFPTRGRRPANCVSAFSAGDMKRYLWTRTSVEFLTNRVIRSYRLIRQRATTSRATHSGNCSPRDRRIFDVEKWRMSLHRESVIRLNCSGHLHALGRTCARSWRRWRSRKTQTTGINGDRYCCIVYHAM